MNYVVKLKPKTALSYQKVYSFISKRGPVGLLLHCAVFLFHYLKKNSQLGHNKLIVGKTKVISFNVNTPWLQIISKYVANLFYYARDVRPTINIYASHSLCTVSYIFHIMYMKSTTIFARFLFQNQSHNLKYWKEVVSNFQKQCCLKFKYFSEFRALIFTSINIFATT